MSARTPFGYRREINGQLVPFADEQSAIWRMAELHHAGWSLRAIAKQMNADGFHLSHSGVKKVLDASDFRRIKNAQVVQKLEQEAWNAGFAAGVANDTRYPYDANDVIKSCSWYAGWMEGEGNRGIARNGQYPRKRA